MGRSILGLIIGAVVGIFIVFFFAPILGDWGPDFLAWLYPVLIFPATVLGWLVGGVGNIAGGVLIALILTVAVYAAIGFGIGKMLDRRSRKT